jgi:alpha-L-fucosidase 2
VTIWYAAPAQRWDEALPIGNGRLGAMVFGGLDEERLALNVDTLWSGGPHDAGVTDGPRVLAQARNLLAATGDRAAAASLTTALQGPDSESYQPLGDLRLRWQPGPDLRAHREPETSGDGYRRYLDLHSAVASVTCPGRGLDQRDVLASRPDNVIMMRMRAAPGHVFDIEVRFDTPHREVRRSSGAAGRLTATGRVPVHVDPPHRDLPHSIRYGDGCGMLFAIAVDVITDSGLVGARDGALTVASATDLTVLIAADSSFRDWRTEPGDDRDELIRRCAAVLDEARSRTAEEIARRHTDDHRALFDRVALELASPEHGSVPTDERVRRFRAGAEDLGLETLLFDYGRYLLIASSRPGTQAANLQGMWCEDVQPSWSCDYTTNINVQMNYWAAESTGLPECHLPLIDLVEALAESGARTARALYDCRGWVVHHNADLWKATWPVQGDPMWAMWPMGAGWLCRHLVEHADFTGDQDFLRRRAWPAVRDAARFLLDFLVEDAENRLVTFPSTSPENTFLDAEGRRVCLDAAPAMDRWIMLELFGSVLSIADRTGLGDPGFLSEVRDALERIPRPVVGPDGRLLEWSEPFREHEPGHRHLSHLYGLYPGTEIDVELTPALAIAARRSLEFRLAHGSGQSGWSRAWALCLWARLGDGAEAHDSVRRMLSEHIAPNLLGLHPPRIFQIDGNLGYTAGVAELLVQSRPSVLRLLPALPPAWVTGRVRGLRARGGIVVDLAWSDGRLAEATLIGDPDQIKVVSAPPNVRLGETRTAAGRRTVLRFEAV